MATDPKIIKILSEDLENLNNIIDDIAISLNGKLNASLTNTKEELEDITKSFKKGKDITKELESNIKKINKESVKLALDRKSIEAQLNILITQNNIQSVKSFKIKKETLEQQLKEVEAQLILNEAQGAYLDLLKEENDKRVKLNDLIGGAKKKLEGFNASYLSTLGILKFIIDAALKANAQTVALGKSLGKDSYAYRENLADVARSSRNVNVSTTNLVEAYNEISEATGLAYEYNQDQLETQILLTKQVGLQADEASQIQRLAVLNGKTSKETYESFVRGLTATRNQLKVGINFKATLAEATKVSGQLAANLGYNPERIAKAIVTAKAFGMTLDQVAKSGESLLNFESSIESELKAELITGKQLNLEKARYAALTGDQVSLAEELANQVGTSAEFTKMNVIQQKSLAEAVGMTTDELANTLRKREEAIASGKSLAQITEEEAQAAIERQNVQDKFNAAILKLQDFFGNLVAGPLGQFISFLAQGLDYITAIGTGMATIYAISKAVQIVQGVTVGLKAAQLASEQGLNATTAARRALLGSELAQTVAIATAWAIANPFKAILGLGVAAGVGIMAYNAAKSAPKFAEGGIVTSEINNATVGEAGPEVIIPLNSSKADKMLGGGNIDLTPMIVAINEVRNAVKDLANRPVTAQINGKDAFADSVGKSSALGTSQTINNSYKLA